jgi:hypothetical protein
LEWATTSPPPPQNFTFIPVATSRTPLWDTPELPVATGLSAERREILVTSLVESEPQCVEPSPRPSIWPFVTAMVVSVTLQTADAPLFGFTPLEDQQLAGLFLWVPGGAIYLAAGLWLLSRWLNHARMPARINNAIANRN